MDPCGSGELFPLPPCKNSALPGLIFSHQSEFVTPDVTGIRASFSMKKVVDLGMQGYWKKRARSKIFHAAVFR
jgi:hypothetical protein